MKPEEKELIGLSFLTRLNLRQEHLARQMLDLIYRQGSEFVPEKLGHGRGWVPMSAISFQTLMEKWLHSYGVVMRRETQFESEIDVTTAFSASGGFNTISIGVAEEYFETQAYTEKFLQLSIALYDLLHPVYGSIHQIRDSIEMATVQDPRYGTTVVPVDLRKGLPGVYWANFFGLGYVEQIGKQRLLAAPCYSISELSDGGILILTAPSPLAPSLQVNRAKQKALRDYLGEELFSHWG